MTDPIRSAGGTPRMQWAVTERTDDFKDVTPQSSPFVYDAMNFISRWDPVFAVYPRSTEEAKADAARIALELKDKLPRLNGQQQALINELRQMGVPDIDIFHGSHVVIKDGGAHYRDWSARDAQTRTSSHYPGVSTPQYEIALGDLGAALFGLDPEGNTWAQLEAAPWARGSLLHRARHSADYLLHVASGKMNVGPLGLSPRSEKVGKQLHVVPGDAASD